MAKGDDQHHCHVNNHQTGTICVPQRSGLLTFAHPQAESYDPEKDGIHGNVRQQITQSVSHHGKGWPRVRLTTELLLGDLGAFLLW